MTDMPLTPPPAAPVGQKADLVPRLIARIIDGLLMAALAIPMFIVAAIGFAISEVLGVLLFLLVFAVLIGVAFYILGWGLGVTGQTPGKRTQGLQVVDVRTGGPIGGGKGVGRVILESVINQFCYVNWIWAIFDPANQTLGDKVLEANVVPGPQGGIMPIFPDGKPF